MFLGPSFPYRHCGALEGFKAEAWYEGPSVTLQNRTELNLFTQVVCQKERRESSQDISLSAATARIFLV